MKKALLILTASITVFFTACTGGVNADLVYGKWKYIKVGVPNSSPPDTVTRAELEDNKPSIELTPKGDFTIMWGGKVLSHGTYKVSGHNIQIHELLPDGKSRDFPFWVSELTDKKITFETTGQDVSQVTAVKE